MLCLGVLIVMSTLNASADSYTVSAVVPNPPGPSAAATIDNVTDGQQFTSSVINVSGTCPTDNLASVYVALYINNVWSGSSSCTGSNTYQITGILSTGSNSIQVRAFDYYNTPAPLLPAITVIYNAPISPIVPSNPVTPSQIVPTVITPAVVAPQSIQILQVDNNIPFVSTSTVNQVSDDPTITGTAPPFSNVVVTIHSNPILCETTADSQGFWSCKVNQTLPLGLHHVFIAATTTSGKILNFTPFEFIATKTAPSKIITPAKFTLTTNFKPTGYVINQPVNFNLNIVGGVSPYAFNINWGDGSNTEVTRALSGEFTISHSYGTTSSLLTNETIKVEGIDSLGNATSLQVFAPIKNPAYTNIVAYVSQASGLWSIFSSAKAWLWVIWPAYAVIILMMFSFWLGERREIELRIMKHHRHSKRLHAKH